MDFDTLKRTYFLNTDNQAECERWMQKALHAAFHFLQNPENHKLHSDITLPELEDVFRDAQPPEVGAGLDATFQQATDVVLRHSVRCGNPYYIGHMTGAVPFFSLVSDLLISALNQNVVKIETALSASFVEGQTTAWLHRLVFGREESFYRKMMHNPDICLGNVTSGGTIGNLTALTVARNLCLPAAAEHGLAQALIEDGKKSCAILASKRVHYSIRKAAAVLGIGGANVVEIPVLPYSNKIDLEALEKTIVELQQAHVKIVALVGIAGSTETGSIDELPQQAAIARKYGIWFHVDAAWGGALLLSKTHRGALTGIELADSVVIDGHKLFYLPLSHGTVLFKNEHHLDSLRHNARYIIRRGSVDLGRTSLEGSRRFDSFKMWFFLKTLGLQGYESLIDHSLALAQTFAALIQEHPQFQLTSLPDTNILTYRYLPPGWKQALRSLIENANCNTAPIPVQSPAPSPDYAAILTFANGFLNDVNVEIQKRQRQNGRSFVSRTTLESVVPGQETVVFRAVPFNPLTSPSILADILVEQDSLGESIARGRWRRLKPGRPKDFDRFFAGP